MTMFPSWAERFRDVHGVLPICGGSSEVTVGVEPGQPQPAHVATPGVDPASGLPDVQARPQQPQPEHHSAEQPRDDQGRFSAEDIERIRKEEKDKLYPQLAKVSELEQRLKTFEEERAASQKTKEQQESEEHERTEAARREEMSAKELVEETRREWETRFNEERARREQQEALLERERQFTTLMQHRTKRLAEEGEDIIPQLRDLVTGSTPEEIDASISSLKERSSAIFQDVQQAQQGIRAAMPGVRPTAPTIGPMEQNEESQQTYSAEDIRARDMTWYIQNRDKLLPAASRAYHDRGSQ